MALDKAVDSAQLDGVLTALADAIRQKSGSTERLDLLSGGFRQAVEALQIGADPAPFTKIEVRTWVGDGSSLYPVAEEVYQNLLGMLVVAVEPYSTKGDEVVFAFGVPARCGRVGGAGSLQGELSQWLYYGGFYSDEKGHRLTVRKDTGYEGLYAVFGAGVSYAVVMLFNR